MLGTLALALGVGSAALFAGVLVKEGKERAELEAQRNELGEAVRVVSRPNPEDLLLEYEIKRVRAMEKELKRRSQLLDEVLREVEELDVSLSIDEAENGESEIALESDVVPFDLGVGGGDYPDDLTEAELQSHRTELRLNSSSVLEKLDSQIEILKSLPIGYPVSGRRSSDFGYRRSPFSGRRQMHRGVDFSVSRHTPIQATGDGTVIEAKYKGGFGRRVVIDHGNGLTSVYAHLQSIRVKAGQKVCRGQEVGTVGSSGRSTGPHLHYEVRHDGKALNPNDFIQLAELIGLF